MKCIRIEVNGEHVVRRCKDEVAIQLVADNRATFAPKKDWKEDGRHYLKPKHS
jgi:hypothetical protein